MRAFIEVKRHDNKARLQQKRYLLYNEHQRSRCICQRNLECFGVHNRGHQKFFELLIHCHFSYGPQPRQNCFQF